MKWQRLGIDVLPNSEGQWIYFLVYLTGSDGAYSPPYGEKNESRIGNTLFLHRKIVMLNLFTYPWLKPHGPLTRYAKLRVAHAPGMPGTFSPPPWISDPDMHHGTCVAHVPWCMSGSLINGVFWRRWRGKRSRHSWRMRNPQCCVSGKRPMVF